MRSEHNGGASLAAFLLAVSTITLLFVSPVEGQVGDACVVTAFPGEPGSCPALDGQGNPLLLCVSGQCQTCESAGSQNTLNCETVFAGDEVQIANCFRDCFGIYVCETNADCRGNRPTCAIPTGFTEGACALGCEVSAFPDAAGSCPDIPVEEVFAGPQICGREGVTSYCVSCARNEQERGITTAADCEKLTEVGQTADVVANCQRQCFGFFACETTADCPDSLPFCGTNGQLRRECFGFFCATNADCPDTLPICNAGQCEISVFSPLDGMGGGSSA